MRALALLLVGCNQIYGLEATRAVDAPAPSPDRDNDAVLNEVDNCPDNANATQHDEDKDAVGDACDPCPMDASTTGDADGDGIDDTCDPSPDADCIVLFDSFAGLDRNDFQFLGGTQVTPGDDDVRLSGTSNHGSIVPRLKGGPKSISVRLVNPTFGIGEIAAASMSNTLIGSGYQCGLVANRFAMGGVTPATVSTPIAPPVAITDELVLDVKHHAAAMPSIECTMTRAGDRFELSHNIDVLPAGGGADVNVTVNGAAITIRAMFVTVARGPTACAPPTIR